MRLLTMTFPLVLVVSLLILVGSDVVFANPEVVVGPLSLIKGQVALHILDEAGVNTTIVCPTKGIDLSNVDSIFWEFGNGTNNLGTFTWSPEEPPTATGSLKGKVNLQRSDHHLEFLSISFDNAGFYKCIVNVPGHNPLASEPWELIVYDIAKTPWISNQKDGLESCVVIDTFSTPAIFPEPTITSGIWSNDQNDFIGPFGTPQITQWQNGSYSYSFVDVRYKITPLMPWNISLAHHTGITKKDGTYISLFEVISGILLYEEKGCHNLSHWDSNVVISYTNNNGHNCRGEILGYTSSTPVKAHYTCREGYRPTNNSDIQAEALCEGPTFNWAQEPSSFQCEPSPEQPDQPGSSSCFNQSSAHIIYLILLVCIFIQ